jgi:CHAD domain-containing protein
MKTAYAVALSSLVTAGAGTLTYVASDDAGISLGVSTGIGIVSFGLTLFSTLTQPRVQSEEDTRAAQGKILQGGIETQRATRVEGAVIRETVREDGEATRSLIREELAKIGQDTGLTPDQTRAILASFGHENVPEEMWAEKLQESAERLAELEARLKALTNDEPEIANLLQRAGDAIDAADFETADALLAEAEQRDVEAGEMRLTRAARSRSQRGDLAYSSGKYVEAAEHYAEAARRIQNLDPQDWARLKYNQGIALYERGQFDPEPELLQQSVAAYREALKERTRKRIPLDWAMTQNNLGTALMTLGARGDDDALRDAITAYRNALKEYTCERVPLDWAMTQNNLGNALRTLGARGDEDALHDAIAAYREALKERTRERVPLGWAMTQNNLGSALRTLGARGDEDALHDAIAAYRDALEEYTRERVPLDWATTQNNLGNALATLGERGDDDALSDAIAAYREALKERIRERVPLSWAMTQNNLGNALKALGERGDDDALERAIAAYRLALEEFTAERTPYYHAIASQNLAEAEALLEDRKNGGE